MGIKSTSYIDRQSAIERISKMLELIKIKHYREIEENTFEDSSSSIENILNDKEVEISNTKILNMNLKYCTNQQLEDILDKPFYRFSMFENYFIKEED